MPSQSESAESRSKQASGVVSLRTLSAHLGLSVAAISRVLSGSPAARSIPPATQERIFAAARELNYRPNLLARSLRRGQSTSVGVLIPDMSEGYSAHVLAGIEETLSAAGYVLVMITHHHREEVLAKSERIFAERAVDAVILVGTTLQLYGTTPTVTVSCPDPHPHVTNIVLDHARAAELALRHLHGLGHRKIAVIKGHPVSSDTEVRWRSIERAAAALGLPLPPERVVQMDEELQTNEPGYRATRKLLGQSRDFSAVFAFNDVSAIGAVAALQDAGLSVPEDVSVMGFDDVAFARVHRPSLTTVRQPLHQMGVMAANAVLDQLSRSGEAHTAAVEVVVEPELMVRATTMSAAVCAVAAAA
ncbi:LacI family DNA-binding transcriptional regulator [Terriglobus sp.]|uniref:LacI family DNA-binding transcriptional regulator n=1 Tax=Terriglobus sp. TaxID=1889013 RepID=UPI003AFF67FA